MEIWVIMTIVWASVIALALIVEYLTYGLVSLWFAPAGVIALVLALTRVGIYWQISVFVVATFVFILAFRPIMKRHFVKPAQPSAIMDVNMGKEVRLASAVEDGMSTIVINDVTWAAKIKGGASSEKGQKVKIVGQDSNIFIVRPMTTDDVESPNDDDSDGDADGDD